MSLFDSDPISSTPVRDKTRPLADRMRPETLEEFSGQEHILGAGKPLRVQIERDAVTSIILWGPPGVGKTTLARIIARMTRSEFLPFSAVLSGIKEIKAVMADAERLRRLGRRTILFIDEIHRFNRAQQDAFLPYVESGDIILIGATTENPSFEVNAALLSRSKVFSLRALTVPEIAELLGRALSDRERGLGDRSITAAPELLEQIAIISNGDARSAYNTLEGAVAAATGSELTPQNVEDAMQRKVLLYDKSGEEHYNLISALHKSVRSSQVDAALYWLARMLEAGETGSTLRDAWYGWPSKISVWQIHEPWSKPSRQRRLFTSWGSRKATLRWRKSPSTWRSRPSPMLRTKRSVPLWRMSATASRNPCR